MLLRECLSAPGLLHNLLLLLDRLQVLHSSGYLSQRKDFHVLSRRTGAGNGSVCASLREVLWLLVRRRVERSLSCPSCASCYLHNSYAALSRLRSLHVSHCKVGPFDTSSQVFCSAALESSVESTVFSE